MLDFSITPLTQRELERFAAAMLAGYTLSRLVLDSSYHDPEESSHEDARTEGPLL